MPASPTHLPYGHCLAFHAKEVYATLPFHMPNGMPARGDRRAKRHDASDFYCSISVVAGPEKARAGNVACEESVIRLAADNIIMMARPKAMPANASPPYRPSALPRGDATIIIAYRRRPPDKAILISSFLLKTLLFMLDD